MSAGVRPACAKARGPVQAVAEWVMSMSPPDWPLTEADMARTCTRGCFKPLARSGCTSTTAPPPSVTTQQSARRSGSATRGEASTSSTVITWRSSAFGLCCAWCDMATLIQASCSAVVPKSCMWRMAHMA